MHGVASSPAIFQKCMENILVGIPTLIMPKLNRHIKAIKLLTVYFCSPGTVVSDV